MEADTHSAILSPIFLSSMWALQFCDLAITPHAHAQSTDLALQLDVSFRVG